ncbi:protein farnesyltransferase/geranylgeranyltransferase type-1 subunit alpha [Nematocida homosporus]|uniref:protein farnesyltransferase/geranylgeranyltransferase type-1 subunit alpha n=1 Tax=Nematocida homosporus TaxID=1912981 RepID=UPI002220286D|nr:protein farnesyltransferase/geranylgeranyltransferase type-1 subunit alpha [Nematocida homosporus]KAI5185121.1 protein farnesyltransferase/geranylgeranyltransferase type-1 subunit alpha [Nematocida homosporus]
MTSLLRFKHHSVYLLTIDKHKHNIHNKIYTFESLSVLNELLYYAPSDYSLWMDRRQLIAHIPTTEYTMEQEFQWTKQTAAENQKNYQVWNHLLFVVKQLKYDITRDPDIYNMAKEEPKNIHFWGFFLSTVKLFSSHERAIAFATIFIKLDIRNNSAYAIKYALLSHFLPLCSEIERLAYIQLEQTFLGKINRLKNNPAFWNYVSALPRLDPQFQGIHSQCSAAHEDSNYHED